jgi:inorganic phosphate transporter, PiT family
MPVEYIILALGFVVGFHMSWNIGANDVANSMASAVGAKAITMRQAIVIAGVLVIIGAAFIGGHVTDTIRSGIISPQVLEDRRIAIIGAFSALMAASLWVSFATWKSLPVSTTHSVVGAMVGFGIITGGLDVINWGVLGAVVSSWVISPVFSMTISFLMFKLIVKVVLSSRDAFASALRFSPVFIGIAVFVVVMSFLFKTPTGKLMALNDLSAMLVAGIMGVACGFAGQALLTRYFRKAKTKEAELIFRTIQIGTSCYVALAIGANDVANAIGPLALIYFLTRTGQVGAQIPVPYYLLLFGGVGIAIGIAMGGARVIRTVGERITLLTNTRGYSVDFAAATTVLLASKLGLPVSTTHAAVGGVLGVGLARGLEAVNFAIIFKIMLYWVLTVPAAAITSMIIFKAIESIV